MKKFALVFSLAIGVAGLAFAQEPIKDTAAKPDAAKAQAAKPAKEQAGEVVSVDVEKKTLTFKNEMGENLTWPAEGKALASLKTVKPGDKVTIAYAVDDRGAPKAATEIKLAKPTLDKAAPAKPQVP